jgi:hypothetical protein
MTQVQNPSVGSDSKHFTFRFKKDKLGNQRNKVELDLPVPSFEGMISILEGYGTDPEKFKKQFELLQEAMYDVVRGVVADIVNENADVSQENFPVAKVTWEAIANMPKEDRRSASIATELWEAFAKDYLEIMPSVTGKKLENIEAAVTVYLKKFTIIKTDKTSLKILQNQLALYVEHTKRGEEFQEIIELLTRRLDTYLKADDIAELTSKL